MAQLLSLNAKNKNRLAWSYDTDLSGYQIIFRLKKRLEDVTTPLIEVLGTILTATTNLTEGYFDIDLSATDYVGQYFYEIEINDATTINGTPTTPPIFNLAPTICNIQTRLDN